MTERLISAAKHEPDAFEATIRPRSLAEFIGQEQARANLRVVPSRYGHCVKLALKRR